MLVPTGAREYAPGSISCAPAASADKSSASGSEMALEILMEYPKLCTQVMVDPQASGLFHIGSFPGPDLNPCSIKEPFVILKADPAVRFGGE